MRIPKFVFKLVGAGLMAALLVPLYAVADDAPAPTPVRVRGTVESFQGQTLIVKARNGDTDTIALPQDSKVSTVKKVGLGDIKTGDFVGAAAIPGANGHLKALELHLFPEAMRGAGEGFRPFDLQPNSSMTNATVGQITAMSESGRTLTMTYKDGQQIVDVPPDVPVVTFAQGDASMLQPGKAIIVFAAKQADGAMTARNIVVESGGVKPPM